MDGWSPLALNITTLDKWLTLWITSQNSLKKIKHWQDGCCKMIYSIDLPRYRAFLENGHPLCGKALLDLDGYPCHRHSLPISSLLQLSKFPSSFGDHCQILSICTLKLPIPQALQQLPAWDNNNSQNENDYIRVITLQLHQRSADLGITLQLWQNTY